MRPRRLWCRPLSPPTSRIRAPPQAFLQDWRYLRTAGTAAAHERSHATQGAPTPATSARPRSKAANLALPSSHVASIRWRVRNSPTPHTLAPGSHVPGQIPVPPRRLARTPCAQLHRSSNAARPLPFGTSPAPPAVHDKAFGTRPSTLPPQPPAFPWPRRYEYIRRVFHHAYLIPPSLSLHIS